MTRTMYDSVNVDAIPHDAQMVAGYVDGHWQTYPVLQQRFPHAVVVSITVFGQPGAMVADVERGDLTPAQGAAWAKREKQAGRHPTLYCSQAFWGDCIAACHAVGLNAETDVSWWIAAYAPKPDPSIPKGAVAHQYADTGPYDVSSVVDHWPGVDRLPHGEPPSSIANPVWWSHPTDGNQPGWRDVHNPALKPSSTGVFAPDGTPLRWTQTGWHR